MQLIVEKSISTGLVAQGKGLGDNHGSEIRQVTELYTNYFRDQGLEKVSIERIVHECRDALESWYPELLLELEAIAKSSGVSLDAIMTVTARTEILAALDNKDKGECSTAVLLPAGGGPPESIQTWDWHDFLTPFGLLWTYESSTGLQVKTFTEFGAPAKIGINSAGIGVHFNILKHKLDGGVGGVPVHAVARRILDQATSIEEAVSIAKSAKVSASTAITVISPAPDAVTIELSPAGVEVVIPWPAGDHRVLLHTNHFLHESFSRGEAFPSFTESCQRLEYLGSQAPDWDAAEPISRALEFCGPSGGKAPICATPDLEKPLSQQWKTLVTVTLDAKSRKLQCGPGNPVEFAESSPIVL